jgi:Mn-dependent DtxR family transcriptional regulator
MNSDALDAMVLRAMLRLARRRQPGEDGEIAVRVGQPPHEVRTALRRLDALGLVERRGEGDSRLTMTGFALAVAGLPSGVKRPRSVRRTSRAA